jgi:hypothetical protein
MLVDIKYVAVYEVIPIARHRCMEVSSAVHKKRWSGVYHSHLASTAQPPATDQQSIQMPSKSAKK